MYKDVTPTINKKWCCNSFFEQQLKKQKKFL